MKKFEDIWKKANEEADLKYDPKGVLSRSLILYSALKKRIEPLLEKQQPEIPEFVANEIEEKNRRFSNFHKTANIESYVKEVRDWYYEKPYHAELFYRAILDGYTVAKEKLYKVVFPKSHSVLCKTGEVVSFAETVYEKYLLENAMTELEIKAIDERYWQFAVPVEEK